MTQTYRIASIPADGVGKEVIAAGRRVLDFVAEQSNGAFAFQWDDFDWGSEYYARHGKMMAGNHSGVASVTGVTDVRIGRRGVWSSARSVTIMRGWLDRMT